MAKKTRRSTASRGAVNNIILESLYSGRKYGYEIIKQVEDSTNGDIVLKQPSLYSSLTRFENKGYVTSSWADSEIGGRRHYYELTPEGKKYYENNVLNKRSSYEFLNDDYVFEKNVFNFDEDNDDTEIEESNEVEETPFDYDDIEEDEEKISGFNKYDFDVQDKLNSLLEDISDDELEDENSFNEYNEKSSFDEDNIPYYEDEEEVIDEPIVKDEVLNEDNADNDVYQDIYQIHSSYNNKIVDDYATNDNYLSKEFSEVYNSIVNPDKKDVYAEESDDVREQKKQESMQILYGNKEQTSENKEPTHSKYIFNDAKPTYYIDENGITKQFIQNNDKEDVQNYNVINSYNPDTVLEAPFNSSDFDEILSKSKKYPTKKIEDTQQQFFVDDDLSDEERERRNKLFQEKFDMIADSRMIKSTPAHINEEENQSIFESTKEETFDNIEDDNDNSYYFAYNDEVDNTDEPKIVENNIKVSEYDRTKTIEDNLDRTNYIKINKAKFMLGIVMLVLMLIEVTTLLVILKANNMPSSDNILFVICYILIVIISTILMVPVFINANKRKLNNFKFGYSLALSILSFLVLSTLTYAINSFLGFDLNNFEYFYAKLILPIIMSFNLVIGTIVYKIISLNKRLY